MNTTTVKKLTYAEKVDLYDKLIKTNPNLERKGDTIPCTSLNGDMFTYLSKSGSVASGRNTPKFRTHFFREQES